MTHKLHQEMDQHQLGNKFLQHQANFMNLLYNKLKIFMMHMLITSKVEKIHKTNIVAYLICFL